jgi:hypothetical protein
VPQVIIDTSMLVPRLDVRDSIRQPALHLWLALEQGKWDVIVFDCVANETISVLCRRFIERQQYAEWPMAFARFQAFCHQHPPYWSSRRIESVFSAILDLIDQHAGRLIFMTP